MRKPTVPPMTIYANVIPPAWYQPQGVAEEVKAPFTTVEAAKALGVGSTTVKALIASGELKSFKTRARRFVTRESVTEYIARRERGGGRRAK